MDLSNEQFKPGDLILVQRDNGIEMAEVIAVSSHNKYRLVAQTCDNRKPFRAEITSCHLLERDIGKPDCK